MALGDMKMFQWKSKATQQKEQEEYDKWAFPYGKKQRDNLQSLLFELYPKESMPTTLVPFLTCKELYEQALRSTGGSDYAIDMLLNKQRKYKQIIRKKDMATYLALVLADASVGESCEYPAAQEITARAQKLEELRKE